MIDTSTSPITPDLDTTTIAQIERRRPAVTVTVTAIHGTVAWHPIPIVRTFVVVTSLGYRAQLRACDHEPCLDGTIPACSCGERLDRPGWRRHAREWCHGWHEGKVVALAETIAKSHGAPAHRIPSPGRRRDGYLAGDYAPCPSWPIVKTPRSTWFADGRDRPASYDTITTGA